MTNDRFNFSLPQELKDKLIRDSLLHNFSTSSAYLQELINKGLPASESLDLRLQLIEKKFDSLADNVKAHNNRTFSILEKVFKRVYIIYRIAANTMARTFYIKPGSISQDDMDESNSIIKNEVEKIEGKIGSD